MAGDATPYVAHRNVVGIIVEKDAGTPQEMDALRTKAGKPTLPVWFVAFGDGRNWAGDIATTAADHRNMGVTYSSTASTATRPTCAGHRRRRQAPATPP